MDPERLPGIVVPHARPTEERVQAIGQVLRGSAGLAAVGQPREREHREVARRDHVHVVARSPHLHEEGSSQVDGFAPSTRAWIDRSAALGMLS